MNLYFGYLDDELDSFGQSLVPTQDLEIFDNPGHFSLIEIYPKTRIYKDLPPRHFLDLVWTPFPHPLEQLVQCDQDVHDVTDLYAGVVDL